MRTQAVHSCQTYMCTELQSRIEFSLVLDHAFRTHIHNHHPVVATHSPNSQDQDNHFNPMKGGLIQPRIVLIWKITLFGKVLNKTFDSNGII